MKHFFEGWGNFLGSKFVGKVLGFFLIFTLFVPSLVFLEGFWSDDDDDPLPPTLTPPPSPPPAKQMG